MSRSLHFSGLASCLAGLVGLAGCVPSTDGAQDESSFLSGLGDEKSDGLASPYTATAAWSATYEATFSDWVQQLGRARADGTCTQLTDCLQSPVANALYLPEDQGLQMFADCADLPYVLRAYFAYKQRLPFSFMSSINGAQYTAGNTPLARRSHRNFSSFATMTKFIANNVHSGFFRMAPTVENNDLYTIDIDRSTVRPGAVYYDPNGHVLVVYDVDSDGTVRFIDGHPDNSLTAVRFGSDLARGSAAYGGGFHQWRAQKLVNNAFKISGNAASPGYSATAQYQASYDVDGQSLDYFDWVRAKLNEAGPLDLIHELNAQLDSICESLQTRVAAVAAGAGMSAQPHPGVLPDNIFGTTGDWEAYSTPGRDARLKLLVRNAYTLIEYATISVSKGAYAFDGTRDELIEAMRSTYFTRAAACTLTYQKSDGTPVTLDMSDLSSRLFAMSFDPYHCPEMRWGARNGAEMATCPADELKTEMYESEQSLRNIVDRDDLTSTPLGSGPWSSPHLDIGLLLNTLQ